MRGFLKWLLRQNFVSEDYSLRLVSSKVPHKLPHFISIDEALSLVRSLEPRALRACWSSYSMAAACASAKPAVCVGAISCAKSRSLRVLGKGGRTRIVVLPDMVWSALMSLPQQSDYVLSAHHPFRRGRPTRLSARLERKRDCWRLCTHTRSAIATPPTCSRPAPI